MFFISPGVRVSEIDRATSIPAVSTTEAGMAGVFRWGPVEQRVLVTSENDLVSRFGKPSNYNAETWFVAADFLNYGTQLHVIRAETGTSAMAVYSGQTAPAANTQTIKNKEHYESGDVTFDANVAYVAKYPGELGNSLRIAVCDSTAAYSSNVAVTGNDEIIDTSSNVSITVGSSTATVVVGFTANGDQSDANTQAYAVQESLIVGDNIKVGNSTIGEQYIKISALNTVTGNSTTASFTMTLAEPYRLREDWSANTIQRFWEFHNNVNQAPGTSEYVESYGNTSAIDEMHLVIVDEDGGFTGSPGNILEVYDSISRATDAKTPDGTVNYYKTVVNDRSNYIWWATDSSTAVSNTSGNVASSSATLPASYSLQGGTDGNDESNVSLAAVAAGYDLLKDSSAVDISLVLAGKARNSDGATLVNYIIDNVSAYRKDCVTFASPPKETVVNNSGSEVDSVVTFAESLRASSYAFLDSGYKYRYDKYNDVYRWVPMNGDCAGICVRTDLTNDAWWSPAGFNRGHVLNVAKLAFNPNNAQRDLLAKASVNAIINEKGEGTVLFDDRTLLKKNSPFRAIGVRRLFIILEKAIATDAKYSLFEFNDEFTRAQFRNRVIPYLRDIMGRRGIIEFNVVCDETNNTEQVIAAEEFVGDIYIRPNRSIRGIQLNFIAVRGSVSFSELIS